MSYKICPGTTTPATKTLSASTGITHRLCTSVLRKEEKFNHCRLDTPKTGHVFLLLLVSENTLAQGRLGFLNNMPNMTRTWVTQSVSTCRFPAPQTVMHRWRYTPVSQVIFIQWFAYLNEKCLICIWHKFPIQCCITIVKGEHPHKALGPLYFPTTISNHSSGTVTQQSVKEINYQIWHSTPISLAFHLSYTRKKENMTIKSLREKHAVAQRRPKERIQCRAQRAKQRRVRMEDWGGGHMGIG